MTFRVWLCFLLSTVTALSQLPSAEITGTVRDATGGLIAGAAVTVTNSSTNTENRGDQCFRHFRRGGIASRNLVHENLENRLQGGGTQRCRVAGGPGSPHGFHYAGR